MLPWALDDHQVRRLRSSSTKTPLQASPLWKKLSDEILYAILHHFRGLKRLEIMYKEGDPTEVHFLFPLIVARC